MKLIRGDKGKKSDENCYKDFFDQMIYSYGVDEGIVLDRTIYHGRTFAQLDLKGISFKFPHDYGFLRLQDKKNLSTHERYRKLVNQIRRASCGYSENFDFIILYYNEKLYCLYYKNSLISIVNLFRLMKKRFKVLITIKFICYANLNVINRSPISHRKN